MRTEENKAVVRRYAEQVWNGGDLTAVEEFIAPDYVRHDPGLPMEVRGPDGVRAVIVAYRTALPDLHLTLDDTLADGDKVVLRLDVRGTHQGDLMGIPPSGRAVEITAIEIFRLDGGKIVEQWVAVDNLGLMRQIGALETV